MSRPVEPTLAQLQARMAAALLAADADGQALPEGWFAGPVPPAESLRVHRNTVLGAIANALRLSYPAIDRLVGEGYFDRLAVEYARAEPPRAPHLSAHAAGFVHFAATHEGLAHLPFIGELAHLEWQFDELARCAPDAAAPPDGVAAVNRVDAAGDALPVGGGLAVRFVPSLRVLASRYPLLAMREALLAADAARVDALAVAPGEHAQALWRDPQGVRARTLHPAAARCLALLLAGDDLQAALEAARGDLDEEAFMGVVRSDLLEAGFTTLVPEGA